MLAGAGKTALLEYHRSWEALGHLVLPARITEFAVGPGTQGAQFLAEAAEGVGLLAPGLDPGLDQLGAQADDGASPA